MRLLRTAAAGIEPGRFLSARRMGFPCAGAILARHRLAATRIEAEAPDQCPIPKARREALSASPPARAPPQLFRRKVMTAPDKTRANISSSISQPRAGTIRGATPPSRLKLTVIVHAAVIAGIV